jgi:hypothetical protein
MTIHDEILAAVRIQLNGKLDEPFRSGDLRALCGIPQGSFSPVFKGMRTDPGTAPILTERVRGLFVQLERGVYVLSEKGKRAILASSDPDFSAASEREASILADEGYWSSELNVDQRQRALREVVQRRGQPEFRKRLLEAYDHSCAVTGSDAVAALEAAHIAPYLGEQSNLTSNGLLLRADLHTLFDLNLFGIEPSSLRITLSKSLLASSYAVIHEQRLRSPGQASDSPSKDALALRWELFLHAC